jgi:hypothetical protein
MPTPPGTFVPEEATVPQRMVWTPAGCWSTVGGGADSSRDRAPLCAGCVLWRQLDVGVGAKGMMLPLSVGLVRVQVPH